MKRDFLKELELDDEVIGKIMAEHGKTVNSIKEQADQVDGLNSQIEDYKQQIKDRDKQLEDLKKQSGDNQELKDQIKQMEKDNQQVQDDLNQKLEQQKKESKLELALKDAQARNPKAVKALLDSDKISLDGDNLIGLEDQLKGLKESDAYLFGEDKPAGLQGRDPVPGNDDHKPKEVTKEQFNKMGYQERAQLFQEQPDVYKQLTNE